MLVIEKPSQVPEEDFLESGMDVEAIQHPALINARVDSHVRVYPVRIPSIVQTSNINTLASHYFPPLTPLPLPFPTSLLTFTSTSSSPHIFNHSPHSY